MAIKLVIDSASDISKEEAKKLGIHVIPIIISFGEEDFLDGETLLPNEFYSKLASSTNLPTTSQITPFRYQEELDQLVNNGDEVVLITLSSKISGTYNNAKQAAEKYNGKVVVIDSLNACTGERLLGLYALQLIKENKSLKEIEEILNNAKTKINVIAMIDTLKYLKKGGRISAAAAVAGELFSIKPLISVIDGKVKVIGKCMGIKKAFINLNNLIQQKGGIDLNLPCGAIWSGTDETNIEKYLNDSTSTWNKDLKISKYVLGGTIGTHIGPGAVGLAFFEK